MKLVIFDLDDTLFDTTGQLDRTYAGINRIRSFRGVKKILSAPGKKVVNVLVTAGEMSIQEKKIEVLRIGKYFGEICFCPKAHEKLDCFARLKGFYQERVTEIIAVGNRIDCEITYGNALGFTTILLRHGKHKNMVSKGHLQRPTHTISKFSELAQYL